MRVCVCVCVCVCAPAVHYDGVVPGLLLLSLDGGHQIYHATALCGDPDLRPAVEVEVSDVARVLLLLINGD